MTNPLLEAFTKEELILEITKRTKELDALKVQLKQVGLCDACFTDFHGGAE